MAVGIFAIKQFTVMAAKRLASLVRIYNRHGIGSNRGTASHLRRAAKLLILMARDNSEPQTPGLFRAS